MKTSSLFASILLWSLYVSGTRADCPATMRIPESLSLEYIQVYPSWESSLQIFKNLTVPCDGVLSKWILVPQNDMVRGLHLAVFRQRQSSLIFDLVGERAVNRTLPEGSAGNWIYYPLNVRIEVRKNDVLGFYYDSLNIPREQLTISTEESAPTGCGNAPCRANTALSVPITASQVAKDSYVDTTQAKVSLKTVAFGAVLDTISIIGSTRITTTTTIRTTTTTTTARRTTTSTTTTTKKPRQVAETSTNKPVLRLASPISREATTTTTTRRPTTRTLVPLVPRPVNQPARAALQPVNQKPTTTTTTTDLPTPATLPARQSKPVALLNVQSKPADLQPLRQSSSVNRPAALQPVNQKPATTTTSVRPPAAQNKPVALQSVQSKPTALQQSASANKPTALQPVNQNQNKPIPLQPSNRATGNKPTLLQPVNGQ